MQERQAKDMSAEKGAQRKISRKAASQLARIPFRREDVLEEQTFRAMLALERRRAERSRQPFVLMLLDASALSGERGGPAFVEKLAPAVSASVRESDLIGWYQEGAVLSVIFTEISMETEGSITEVLCTRVAKALRGSLDPKLAAKLILTVHLFPESWGTGRSGRVADAKLYPDLNEGAPPRQFAMMIKRGMDILGSVVLMVVLAPLLAAIAVAIKVTSKGPVIFQQERLGQFGKRFQCLKFRTMFTDNDSKIHQEYVQNFISGKVQEDKGSDAGPIVYKIKEDPRVTPIGRWLRRASLDEFPQFWNVLRGEMSLVGPRPPLQYEFEAYDFWHQRRVLEVKPGVTGLWQVMGRSRTSFDDMVRMDLRYCQRWSLWLDLKILLATPLAVFWGHGAY